MKLKKAVLIGLFAATGLVLQACGGGDSDNFFLVTNTKSGHVCVNDLDISADSREGQAAAAVLYAYYGFRGGEADINSGEVSCRDAHDRAGARDPDLTISADYYRDVVVPAVNAKR